MSVCLPCSLRVSLYLVVCYHRGKIDWTYYEREIFMVSYVVCRSRGKTKTGKDTHEKNIARKGSREDTKILQFTTLLLMPPPRKVLSLCGSPTKELVQKYFLILGRRSLSRRRMVQKDMAAEANELAN